MQTFSSQFLSFQLILSQIKRLCSLTLVLMMILIEMFHVDVIFWTRWYLFEWRKINWMFIFFWSFSVPNRISSLLLFSNHLLFNYFKFSPRSKKFHRYHFMFIHARGFESNFKRFATNHIDYHNILNFQINSNTCSDLQLMIIALNSLYFVSEHPWNEKYKSKTFHILFYAMTE